MRPSTWVEAISGVSTDLEKKSRRATLRRRILGVLVDEKLDMNQCCKHEAQKVDQILVCIKIGVISVVKEVTDPILCCSCEVLATALYPDFRTAAQERCGAFGFFQRSATRIIKGLKHLSFEEKLRQLGLFSLQK